MLRHEAATVDNLVVHIVTKLVALHRKDGQEIFYVLQQQCLRLLGRDDSCDVVKQRALRGALKTMRATQHIFSIRPRC